MNNKLYSYFRSTALTMLFLIASMNTLANEKNDSLGNTPAKELNDSLEISLLTCAPHDEIYSLYGHTALRIQDKSQGLDLVVNYGLFDFSAPHFVLRFIFGLTDYSMGFTSCELFKQEYAYYGSKVTQQRINLNEEEKANIMEALRVNALPENIIYRYNYFYDNCTTRARDMLVDHLSGKVKYNTSNDSTVTYRDLVHSCNTNHPWARFGNDMLLGIRADQPISIEQQQFLPRNLMRDFANAEIVQSDGTVRKLVSEETTLLEPGVVVEENGFPLSPTACALILLAITIVITVLEHFMDKKFWLFDLLLMLAAGLSGIVLFLMIFSAHPTVRINLQLLLLNPLPLFFVYPVIKKLRHRQSHVWWKIWAILILLFFIGGFFQKYAEGTYVLALCLLIRSIVNFRLSKKAFNHK